MLKMLSYGAGNLSFQPHKKNCKEPSTDHSCTDFLLGIKVKILFCGGSHLRIPIHINIIYFARNHPMILGPSWSYGSWIYNYLCDKCLSPLKLWVWTLFMLRCTIQHNVIKFVSDLRQIGGFLRFPPSIKLTVTI